MTKYSFKKNYIINKLFYLRTYLNAAFNSSAVEAALCALRMAKLFIITAFGDNVAASENVRRATFFNNVRLTRGIILSIKEILRKNNVEKKYQE